MPPNLVMLISARALMPMLEAIRKGDKWRGTDAYAKDMVELTAKWLEEGDECDRAVAHKLLEQLDAPDDDW